MAVVRRADVYDVGRRGVEHRGEVGEVRAAPAGGGLQTAMLVDVADPDEFDPSVGAGSCGVEDRVEVDRGDVAAADDGDSQRFQGHDRPPRGRVAMAQS